MKQLNFLNHSEIAISIFYLNNAQHDDCVYRTYPFQILLQFYVSLLLFISSSSFYCFMLRNFIAFSEKTFFCKQTCFLCYWSLMLVSYTTIQTTFSSSWYNSVPIILKFESSRANPKTYFFMYKAAISICIQ